MARKRKTRCAHCCQWRSEACTVHRTSCEHALCRVCLATICVDATTAAATGAFVAAQCQICGREIPLAAVQQELSTSVFETYERMWRESHADCVSCANVEPKCELRAMPCGHWYCRECVRRMCRLALGDRVLVPIRCCQKEIPVDYVREALPTSADYALYNRFMREKNWRTSELVSDAEYATIVQRVGAKQCPGCGVGVQRDFGCVHITCPSGHEFCFTCLRVWQTCKCPLLPDVEVQRILGE